MSLINLLVKRGPQLGSLQFDAVLSDDLDASVDIVQYPIETGTPIADHIIYQPIRYTMTGAVSNNPLKVSITDFTGALTNLVDDNPFIAAGAGLFAGWLSGSNETRSSTTLNTLLDFMYSGQVFTVDTGEITLNNMVIRRIGRSKDPENENGLIFVAELQQIVTLDRVANGSQPAQYQLNSDDVSSTSISGLIERGYINVKTAATNVADQVTTLLDL
ncbi:baseplate organization protein [Klebsiella phage SBP]|uniref:Baseplate organization protein n=1 Tax=Klebsiella phage SBP TaxID=2973661 RepID=A0A9X9JTV9_9CAUD|nr:tail fiber protein [Klebsiella phage SBP]UYE94764.1 baseplate organization protein [Klebsiella phage SBP]